MSIFSFKNNIQKHDIKFWFLVSKVNQKVDLANFICFSKKWFHNLKKQTVSFTQETLLLLFWNKLCLLCPLGKNCWRHGAGHHPLPISMENVSSNEQSSVSQITSLPASWNVFWQRDFKLKQDRIVKLVRRLGIHLKFLRNLGKNILMFKKLTFKGKWHDWIILVSFLKVWRTFWKKFSCVNVNIKVFYNFV